MSNPEQAIFKKGEGYTTSEKYLNELCERTFLSLWSFPNVYRQPGTELCDLLVVFGNEILIFSDKSCVFPDSGKIEVDWRRWFKRTVQNSANQLWGAERWIKQFPERIFLNPKCTQPLPFPITISDKTSIHLILVAHGGSMACEKFHGGSGSMMYHSPISGLDNHTTPFAIGDIDPSKTFVHVLDDTTLDILLNERDTIADFTDYIKKREKYLRSGIMVISPGEEELLVRFLKDLNEETGEHDFVLPLAKDGRPIDGIAYTEGEWDDFLKSPERKARKKADEISYSWDKIIEKFAHHATHGTAYKNSSHGITGTEQSLRVMASENRFMRRLLSIAIHEMLSKTQPNQRMIRIVPSVAMEGLHYVLLLFPTHLGKSHEEYRRVRESFLQKSCMVARLMNPSIKHILGFATETGLDPKRSEDLLYFDCKNWDSEIEEQARIDQRELKILINPTQILRKETEYPEPKKMQTSKKVGRNDPCPCGSRKKYKKCHGQ